jgi:hypothetical protein
LVPEKTTATASKTKILPMTTTLPIKTTLPMTTTEPTAPPATLFDASAHRNFHLINNPDNCGKSHASNRIMNAVNASLYEFPWIVLLGFTSVENVNPNKISFACSGSLIAKRFVLSGLCMNYPF